MLDNLRLLRHYFSFNLRINLPTEVGVSLFLAVPGESFYDNRWQVRADRY